ASMAPDLADRRRLRRRRAGAVRAAVQGPRTRRGPRPFPPRPGHPGENPMTMTRRQFLSRSALCGTAAFLATSTAGRAFAAAAQGKPMGIQLYMILKAYQDDPVGALKTLKEIGYT